MKTDYLGNEIKAGMEICSITILTGGYFKNWGYFVPTEQGGKTVINFPDKPQNPCWEINWCVKVESDHGELCVHTENKEISGYVPLSFLNIQSKEILAIKGVSDNEEMYLNSLSNNPISYV